MSVRSGPPEELFDPETPFRKWAAVEVADLGRVPDGMETYRLEGGTYAVFLHRGPASDVGIFRYILEDWLPASEYALAPREHFEVLPRGYDPRDPDATEHVCVPVEPKE